MLQFINSFCSAQSVKKKLLLMIGHQAWPGIACNCIHMYPHTPLSLGHTQSSRTGLLDMQLSHA